MNYVMSGWPGRDPPRGGSEGPAPMVDRASGEGPCRARQGGGGLVPFSTAPCLRVSDCCGSAGRATTPGVWLGVDVICDIASTATVPRGVRWRPHRPGGRGGVHARRHHTAAGGGGGSPVPSTVLLFHISEHMHICTHEKKERRLP